MAKIRTTHTGSLPRPAALTALLHAEVEGEDSDEIGPMAEQAIRDIVQHQVDVGIDIVNDGEQGKPSYATYVRHRLAGFEGEQTVRPFPEEDEFADLKAIAPIISSANTAFFPQCNGPITVSNRDAVHEDIATLKAAAEAAGIDSHRLFLSAASPGVIASFFGNAFYASREEYLAAIVDAMRYEYRAIVEAGITLQLDCPDFAGFFNSWFGDLSVEDFRRVTAQSVEAMNAALDGLPSELVRFHVCWGNYEGPHVHDIELKDIIDVILRAAPAGIVLESCNPRHAHEWKLFEDVKLPEGKYLAPGVVDTTTNFVEHPELVAQRIANFAQYVGQERVVAGTDCGFATFAGPRRVAPSVAWRKLQSLVEGARLASSTS